MIRLALTTLALSTLLTACGSDDKDSGLAGKVGTDVAGVTYEAGKVVSSGASLKQDGCVYNLPKELEYTIVGGRLKPTDSDLSFQRLTAVDPTNELIGSWRATRSEKANPKMSVVTLSFEATALNAVLDCQDRADLPKK